MRSGQRKIIINEDLNTIEVIQPQPKRVQRPVSSITEQEAYAPQPTRPKNPESTNFIKKLFKKKEDENSNRTRTRDKLRKFF
jgi:hypothetical protein